MQIATATTAPVSGTPSTNTATKPVTQKELGQDDFLKLLAAQLGAQDPMAPTDNTQFISQMANFSSLQQMSALNTNFTAFAAAQKGSEGPSYLGKQVSVLDSTGRTVTGLATAYHLNKSGATITVNGKDYALDKVTDIALPTT